MKQKIYNLLMNEYRSLLASCYERVLRKDSFKPAIKTFDDCLDDFYLYLYEAKPKRVMSDVKGYYLTKVKNEKAMPSWLWQTFMRFLIEENKIMRDMREVLTEYRRQLAASSDEHEIDLTLMHVAFAIAWLNQNESAEDRYLFFRSAYKHFRGFYKWPDGELDDGDVAMLLGIEQGTLRTRTSRLCAKVRSLVSNLNDASIATLHKESLEIAHRIYSDDNPHLECILEELMKKAENDLENHTNFVDLRRDKQCAIRRFEEPVTTSRPDVMYSIEIPSYSSHIRFDRSSSTYSKRTLAVKSFERFIEWC